MQVLCSWYHDGCNTLEATFENTKGFYFGKHSEFDLEKEFLIHREQSYSNYFNGRFKSKFYSNEELEEKRKYFENSTPHPKSGFSRKRWLYEIERVFELSKDFKNYPDAGISYLQLIIKYGI